MKLAIPGARNLKDKRRVVASLKDRLKARFNASVAEVDDLNVWQRATIALAVVGADARLIHGALDRAVDVVRSSGTATLLEYDKETL